MRKITISLLCLVLGCQMVFAGINTNTNQSAAWARMLIRDASTDIDAVYYNPAGLTKLADGFHVSLNNQYITQGKTVINSYSNLNNGEYEGTVSAPLFPGVYAAYKKGKWAFSAGFNPIGGGGGATFDNGLPLFELDPSDLQTITGVSAYSLNTAFEGTSVYFGIQAGVSYAINDMFSVYVGGRYVIAKNTYSGHLKSIMTTYNPGTGDMPVPGPTLLSMLADQADTTSVNMNNLFLGGVNDLATAEGLGLITAPERAQIEGFLTAYGQDPSSMTTQQISGFFSVFADGSRDKAFLLQDQEVDVEQNGSGFAPIISVNISPTDALNIAIRYEFATKIELENSTAEAGGGLYKGGIIGGTATNPVYMFPDGDKTRGDLPAMLAVGVGYKIGTKLGLSGMFHYYFDKTADYGKAMKNEDIVDANNWEAGLGIEYFLNDKLTLSAGYFRNQTGANENYHSDLSYSINTNTFGGGGKYQINDMLAINLGFAYAMYENGKEETIRFPGGNPYATAETVETKYQKNAMIIGLGLDLSF